MTFDKLFKHSGLNKGVFWARKGDGNLLDSAPYELFSLQTFKCLVPKLDDY